MFFLSLVDIAVWAGAYLLMGTIDTIEMAFYFSTVTFTTLGYGDVVIDEQWRLMSAFEAANGIIHYLRIAPSCSRRCGKTGIFYRCAKRTRKLLNLTY
jgi:hypothetical protein